MNCDYAGCENLATRNYQKVWIVFDVTKKGNYKNRRILGGQDPSEENNVHVCEDHIEEYGF